MNPEQCAHKTVYFGSGDYYLFCRECNARWGRLGLGRCEYGVNARGEEVGCDPGQSNRGVGATLSGQDRVKK